MATEKSDSNSSDIKYSSGFALLLRLYWMFIGHIAVIMAAVGICANQLQSSILINSLYFLAAICLPVSRYIEIKKYHGETAEGEPATMAHWKRFTIMVAAYSIALWVVVQVVMRSI
jgi:hypothetical protein